MRLHESPIESIARRGITAEQIAEQLGISVRAVRKKKGIDRFVIGQAAGGIGRNASLYDPGALTLWPAFQAPEKIDRKSARQGRSDCGLPRKVSEELWEQVVARVKALYLANAQQNLKLACEEAERQLTAEGIEVPLDVYMRLRRTHTDHDGQYISEYRRENWKLTHQSQWRKKDTALAMPVLRYDYQSIFESAGWAGEGFGALRVWAIDVRKNDVWTEDFDGTHSMPLGVYIRDGLTGFPLWMEPIRTETQNDLIRAYIACGLAWGTFPDIAVGIDNGRAMIAPRTKGVIAASLPDEAWERAQSRPEIFGAGTSCSPILQNIPNIPQAVFKAALERSFRQMKDEFDATHHPRHYQGGDRKEAVQLTLSAMPVFPTNMLKAGDYYKGLAAWLWGDYVDRSRPNQYPLFKERGWDTSIANVHQYYGGLPSRNGQMPEGTRLAKLLFHATEKPHIVKAQLGYIDVTINGTYARWICKELHAYHGRRVAVIPIPGMEDERAVVMLADDKRDPVFVGFAFNGFVRHVDRIAPAKEARNDAQTHIRTQLREERESAQEGTWHTHNTPTLPATSDRIAGELYIDPNDAEIVDHDDDDTDQLLSDVEDLL